MKGTQCQPTPVVDSNDNVDMNGEGGRVEQAGDDGTKRTRSPGNLSSPNKKRRKKHQTFLNMDIYDDLEKEVQEAAQELILPTENTDKLIPSLNIEDPPQQDPLMRVPVRGINMEEVRKVGGP